MLLPTDFYRILLACLLLPGADCYGQTNFFPNDVSGDWHDSAVWAAGIVPEGGGFSPRIFLDEQAATASVTIQYKPDTTDPNRWNPQYDHLWIGGEDELVTLVQDADPWGGNNLGEGPTEMNTNYFVIGTTSDSARFAGPLKDGGYVLNGGNLNVERAVQLGDGVWLGSPTSGELEISGGTFTYGADGLADPSENLFTIGSHGGTGVLRQTGGTLSVTNGLVVNDGLEIVLGLGIDFSENPTSPGNGFWAMSGGVATVDSLIVGLGGTGIVQQTGGVMNVPNYLVVGAHRQDGGTHPEASIASSGLYTISDGTLNADTGIGEAGFGDMVISGGHVTGEMRVGAARYLLADIGNEDGRLQLQGGILDGHIWIGNDDGGSGEYRQTGGTANGDLTLTNGSVFKSTGALNAGTIFLGNEAAFYTTFEQQGGDSSAAFSLTVGNCRVDLTGGTLNVTGDTVIDSGVTATAGLYNANADHTVGHDLRITSGDYHLSGATSSLDVTNQVVVEAGDFTQVGGSLDVDGGIRIGETASPTSAANFYFSGGFVTAPDLHAGSGAISNLVVTGSGTWNVGQVEVGRQSNANLGIFGADLVLNGDLHLGSGVPSGGRGWLDVNGTSSLTVQNVYAGENSFGDGDISLYGTLDASGTVLLSTGNFLDITGGVLKSGETIVRAAADANQTGIAARHEAGTLTVSGANYDLDGGELDTSMKSTVTFNGTFQQAGSTTHTTPLLDVISGTYTLSGGLIDSTSSSVSGNFVHSETGNHQSTSLTLEMNGEYDFQGGILGVTTTAILGEFFHGGGAFTGSSVTVGGASGALYDLDGAGAKLVAAGLSVTTDGTFTHREGITDITNLAIVESSGAMNVDGATLKAKELEVRLGGLTQLLGGGMLDLGVLGINSSGRVDQISGSTVIFGSLDIDNPGGGGGSQFSLKAGSLEASQLVVDGTQSATDFAFDQTGGAANFGSMTVVGQGACRMNGGSTTVTGATMLLGTGSLLLETGGSLTTGTLDTSSDASALSWSGGTLRMTNQVLTIGGGGTLGSTVDIDGTRGLQVDQSILVNGTGLLRPGAGGSLDVGSLTITSGGEFNQSAGTSHVTGDLTIETSSADIFQVGGGTLTVDGSVVFEESGNSFDPNFEMHGDAVVEIGGDFGIQTGSAFDVATFDQRDSSQLDVDGTLRIGIDYHSGSAEDEYFLRGTSQLTTDGTEIGGNGKAAFWQYAGTTHTVDGVLSVGTRFSGGSYRMVAGTLGTSELRIANGSSASGSVSQSAGNISVAGSVLIGAGNFSDAFYRMYDGTLNANALTTGVGNGADGKFHQTGGTTQVSAAALNRDEFIKTGGSFTSASLTNEGTMMIGGSDFTTAVINSGQLSLGNGTISDLVLNGSLTQQSVGTLNLEVNGAPVSQASWERIIALGQVVLDGELSLNFNLAESFTAQVGDSWEIITSSFDPGSGAPLSGTFSSLTVNGPDLPADQQLVLHYDENSVTLVVEAVIPEKTWPDWVLEHELTGIDAGMDADPDHDGKSNVHEFATGGDPNAFDPDPIQVGVSDGRLTVSFAKPSYRPVGVSLSAEMSSNLTVWDPAELLIDDDSDFSARDIADASDFPRRFARLVVDYSES